MRPTERREGGQNDLFKARLDQIIDLNHPLAKRARTIDWAFLETSFDAAYSDAPGHPHHPRSGKPNRRLRQSHPRRRWLSRPQRAGHAQIQSLYRRPEAALDAGYQAPDAPKISRRTGHRPRKIRTPHGPQSSRRAAWRRRQCSARWRRIQFQIP